MRKMPEVFNEEEAVRLITSTRDYRKKIFYALGFYQCMRISEIAGLKPEHIDLEKNMIYIREARTPNGLPKKDVQRHIPMAPEIKEGLALYKHLLPFTEAIRTLQGWIEKDSVRVLGKRFHAHSLRHSGATHYHHAKGWPISIVQDFLGHADLKTTMIYVRTDPTVMKGWMGVA